MGSNLLNDGKYACKDCNSIDYKLFADKGDGSCKECDGTGHDQGSEALSQFMSLGLADHKIDCKKCSGTGQCQTCGGTGLVVFDPDFDTRESYEKKQLRKPVEPNRNYTPSQSDDNDNSWIIKIIGFILLVIAIIWFIFSVAIPLILINIASIALITGFSKKKWSQWLFPISVIGAFYIVADYNYGWTTKALVNNVNFFSQLIPFFFYLNLTAGLVSLYILVRNFLNYKNPSENELEFSKRNLILIGILLSFGGGIVAMQKYYGTSTFQTMYSNVILEPTENSTPIETNIVTETGMVTDTVKSNLPQETTTYQSSVPDNTEPISPESFYVVCASAVKTEAKAKSNVEKLRKKGFKSDYLWIPDYKSLSGAELYSVYIGPFSTQNECEIATEDYKKIHPSSYGVLVSQENKRVQIDGIGKVVETQKWFCEIYCIAKFLNGFDVDYNLRYSDNDHRHMDITQVINDIN